MTKLEYLDIQIQALEARYRACTELQQAVYRRQAARIAGEHALELIVLGVQMSMIHAELGVLQPLYNKEEAKQENDNRLKAGKEVL